MKQQEYEGRKILNKQFRVGNFMRKWIADKGKVSFPKK